MYASTTYLSHYLGRGGQGTAPPAAAGMEARQGAPLLGFAPARSSQGSRDVRGGTGSCAPIEGSNAQEASPGGREALGCDGAQGPAGGGGKERAGEGGEGWGGTSRLMQGLSYLPVRSLIQQAGGWAAWRGGGRHAAVDQQPAQQQGRNWAEGEGAGGDGEDEEDTLADLRAVLTQSDFQVAAGVGPPRSSHGFIANTNNDTTTSTATTTNNNNHNCSSSSNNSSNNSGSVAAHANALGVAAAGVGLVHGRAQGQWSLVPTAHSPPLGPPPPGPLPDASTSEGAAAACALPLLPIKRQQQQQPQQRRQEQQEQQDQEHQNQQLGSRLGLQGTSLPQLDCTCSTVTRVQVVGRLTLADSHGESYTAYEMEVAAQQGEQAWSWKVRGVRGEGGSRLSHGRCARGTLVQA